MELQRILIVDDAPVIAGMLKRALRMAGFEVTVAQDGQEALLCFETDAPDAVVMDLHLPGMPGLQLSRTMKARRAVPVVIISGNESAEARAAVKANDVDGYLIKPFALDALVEVLRQALDSAHPRGVSYQLSGGAQKRGGPY
jgi:DNA-binding response OmpR family regulator